jgi:hypothetical protein
MSKFEKSIESQMKVEKAKLSLFMLFYHYQKTLIEIIII